MTISLTSVEIKVRDGGSDMERFMRVKQELNPQCFESYCINSHTQTSVNVLNVPLYLVDLEECLISQ